MDFKIRSHCVERAAIWVMPEWNLQVDSIATNSKYEYKLSFSLETISNFDK